jgi:glycerophosphoryl diester phosphodiesterase
MVTTPLLVAVALGAPTEGFAPMPKVRHRVAVCAHRGGSALAPENTLAAYRNAIRLGVDFIEIDVRATRDGRLVISHDSTVDRMTNGQGRVADLDFATVRALDAGAKFGSEYAGEKVPTLDEVLALARGKVGIYLDHKAGPIPDIVAALRKHRMTRSVVVYNGVSALQEWKRLAPDIPVMPGLPDHYRRPGGIAEFLKVLHAEVTDGDTADYTADLVREAQAAGVKVYVDCLGPSNDNPAGWQKALDLGVDGIQTDHPDQLIAYLKR